MRVPVEWLKEFVAIRLTPEALAERLTMAGLEVGGIDSVEGQPVLDLEITPNRADCLSIIGIAREVAAITRQRLKAPRAQGSRVKAEGRKPRASSLEPRATLTVRIEDRKGCARYIGRLIEGVRMGPSPDWMQKRLAACGLRPINNVVDITNYVLLEYGQPLHAFDADHLRQGAIVVRRARANERLTTLDGVARQMAADILVIADAQQAVAVAGVMGGVGSEVTQQTTSIVLESALFDPVTVRRTARALGLSSESSYRFERGVDPAGVAAASTRASALVRELAGGTERVVCDRGAAPPGRTVVTLDQRRLNRWLGTNLSPAQVRTTLVQLACHVGSAEGSATLRVSIPSFRRDLTQEVDLYEELARLTGYDRIPSTVPMAPTTTAASAKSSASYDRVQSLQRLCASLGLTETVNWSLTSAADLERCGIPEAQAVRLANPLSQDHAFLRPSLLVGLLRTVGRNLSQGARGVALFEVGHVVSPLDRPMEGLRLGLALSGLWRQDWHLCEPCDFFRLKGIVQAVLARWGGVLGQLVPTTQPWGEPGQMGEVLADGRVLGMAGQVSQAIARAFDLEDEVWFAELDVAALLERKHPAKAVRPPAAFPPVKRDLSIIVSERTPFEQIDRAIREAAGPLANRIELIDRYTGRQVPEGQHSLTFSIEYRDPSRTLTAAEVDVLHQRIGQMLTTKFNAQLR